MSGDELEGPSVQTTFVRSMNGGAVGKKGATAPRIVVASGTPGNTSGETVTPVEPAPATPARGPYRNRASPPSLHPAARGVGLARSPG